MNYAHETDYVARSPGRVRIRVPALYRSGSEKTRIETRLSTCKHVAAVYANPLTARVLILFDPSASPDEIFAALGLQKQKSNGNSGNNTEHKPARTLRARRQAQKDSAPAQRQLYPAWHLQEADASLEFLGSSRQFGLPAHVAAERLRHGLNLLPQPPTRSSLEILANQFKGLPVLLLGVSALLSVLTGGMSEAVAVVAVLALNAGIGFVTERRAESSIASLSELIDDIAPVLRDGKVLQADAAHIAVGDILVLAPGIRVAADARVIEAVDLSVDESTLTGESMPVTKSSAALNGPVPLADRVNMVYRGTAISAGTGLAVVAGTGMNTKIGAIHSLMTHVQHPATPIQKELDRLGNRLAQAGGAICIGIFAIGLVRGYGLLQMVKASISLAIAAVPEGLPAVATTSLARGIGLMREKNALIRRLHAVETIGAIRIICLDKTGTLTMNRMSAVTIETVRQHVEVRDDKPVLQNDPELFRLLQVGVLCNQAELGNEHPGSSLNGSSTERSLIDLASKAGMRIGEMRDRHPLLTTELRAEGRNYMRTTHAAPGSRRRLVAVKGSPTEVLGLCRYYQSGGQTLELTEEVKADILHGNETMAARRLRVLGFAYAEMEPAEMLDGTPGQLVWIGLAGLADPLRPGAEDLITSFHRAGVRTVMVTGDQGTTAYSIGQTLQLNGDEELQILDSEHLDRIEPEAIKEAAAKVNIFARVSPSHKLHIVQALQKDGEIVAMTGDGINDGPALQAADIGIAMGHGGTDLARSAADVVLKDDRLETLLEAISQGRTISANIRKSLHFLISSNLSEILVVLGSISVGAGHPLTPMQLLWINLLSDVLPAIALAAEPPEADVMNSPPRDPARPLVGKNELKRYAREGSIIAGGSLAAYFYGMARYGPGSRAGTIAFNSLVLGQLMHAFSCRSDRHRIFHHLAKAGPNRQLNLAIGASLALQLLANIIPGLRGLLNTVPMNAVNVIATLAGAGVPLLLNEAAKTAQSARQSAGRAASAAAEKPKATHPRAQSQSAR